MCERDAGTLFDYYANYTKDEMQAAGFSLYGDSDNMIKEVLKTIASKNIFTQTELYNLEFALYDVNLETAKNAFIAGYKAARDEIPQL